MNNINYLIQETLYDHLIEIYPNENIICNKKIPNLDCNGRPDFYIPSRNTVIEFDGNRHYQQSGVIMKDRQKDYVYSKAGLEVIRIPYFIQWSNLLLENIFNVNVEFEQYYSHGFIDSSAVLPADFCELGILRFTDELFRTFEFCKDDIVDSLRNKSEQLGIERVLPPSLYYILK